MAMDIQDMMEELCLLSGADDANYGLVRKTRAVLRKMVEAFKETEQ